MTDPVSFGFMHVAWLFDAAREATKPENQEHLNITGIGPERADEIFSELAHCTVWDGGAVASLQEKAARDPNFLPDAFRLLRASDTYQKPEVRALFASYELNPSEAFAQAVRNWTAPPAANVPGIAEGAAAAVPDGLAGTSRIDLPHGGNVLIKLEGTELRIFFWGQGTRAALTLGEGRVDEQTTHIEGAADVVEFDSFKPESPHILRISETRVGGETVETEIRISQQGARFVRSVMAVDEREFRIDGDRITLRRVMGQGGEQKISATLDAGTSRNELPMILLGDDRETLEWRDNSGRALESAEGIYSGRILQAEGGVSPALPVVVRLVSGPEHDRQLKKVVMPPLIFEATPAENWLTHAAEVAELPLASSNEIVISQGTRIGAQRMGDRILIGITAKRGTSVTLINHTKAFVWVREGMTETWPEDEWSCTYEFCGPRDQTLSVSFFETTPTGQTKTSRYQIRPDGTFGWLSDVDGPPPAPAKRPGAVVIRPRAETAFHEPGRISGPALNLEDLLTLLGTPYLDRPAARSGRVRESLTGHLVGATAVNAMTLRKGAKVDFQVEGMPVTAEFVFDPGHEYEGDPAGLLIRVWPRAGHPSDISIWRRIANESSLTVNGWQFVKVLPQDQPELVTFREGSVVAYFGGPEQRENWGRLIQENRSLELNLVLTESHTERIAVRIPQPLMTPVTNPPANTSSFFKMGNFPVEVRIRGEEGSVFAWPILREPVSLPESTPKVLIDGVPLIAQQVASGPVTGFRYDFQLCKKNPFALEIESPAEKLAYLVGPAVKSEKKDSSLSAVSLPTGAEVHVVRVGRRIEIGYNNPNNSYPVITMPDTWPPSARSSPPHAQELMEEPRYFKREIFGKVVVFEATSDAVTGLLTVSERLDGYNVISELAVDAKGEIGFVRIRGRGMRRGGVLSGSEKPIVNPGLPPEWQIHRALLSTPSEGRLTVESVGGTHFTFTFERIGTGLVIEPLDPAIRQQDTFDDVANGFVQRTFVRTSGQRQGPERFRMTEARFVYPVPEGEPSPRMQKVVSNIEISESGMIRFLEDSFPPAPVRRSRALPMPRRPRLVRKTTKAVAADESGGQANATTATISTTATIPITATSRMRLLKARLITAAREGGLHEIARYLGGLEEKRIASLVFAAQYWRVVLTKQGYGQAVLSLGAREPGETEKVLLLAGTLAKADEDVARMIPATPAVTAGAGLGPANLVAAPALAPGLPIPLLVH